MSEAYKISVVLPCFNDAEFIEQAIDSVLKQSFKCHEIIVVDDGSNKLTKDVLINIKHKISKLITQENRGQSVARNIGIKNATGNFILVLDSDDFFEPSFCEEAILIFKNNKDTKIVTCYANLLVNDKLALIYKPSGGELKNFLTDNEALGSAMFKKEDWIDCGGYDESMNEGFEDWEFYINLLKKGGNAKVIPLPLYNYRKRENTTTARANLKKYELIRYIHKKHKTLFNMHSSHVISNLLVKLERETKDKNKTLERLEFRLGALILKPIRFVKKIFSL